MPSSKNIGKIVYVANTRLPTEKAHGLATVKMCAALASCGWQVDLVVPALWRKNAADPFSYYHAERNFQIHRIATLDFMALKFFEPLFFLIQIFSFSFCALIWCFRRYGKELGQVVFLSHDYPPLYFLSYLSGAKIFYDIHHFPGKNFFYRRLLQKADGFGVQTKWKIDTLKEQFGITPEKIVYWPNGTDVAEFDLAISREEAREKLGLARNKKIIVYTGQLFDWKGVDILIEAAVLLPQNAVVYIVGGSKSDIGRLNSNSRSQNSKVIFAGQRPYREIPLWLKAADVLVLPNTGKQKVSLYYTSPMKLFEYMASGTPIVASAIPSILEIVHEKNAVLAEADNPKDFAEKISWVLKNPKEAEMLGRRARQEVENYTWENRARKISSFLRTAL